MSRFLGQLSSSFCPWKLCHLFSDHIISKKFQKERTKTSVCLFHIKDAMSILSLAPIQMRRFFYWGRHVIAPQCLSKLIGNENIAPEGIGREKQTPLSLLTYARKKVGVGVSRTRKVTVKVFGELLFRGLPTLPNLAVSYYLKYIWLFLMMNQLCFNVNLNARKLRFTHDYVVRFNGRNSTAGARLRHGVFCLSTKLHARTKERELKWGQCPSFFRASALHK